MSTPDSMKRASLASAEKVKSLAETENAHDRFVDSYEDIADSQKQDVKAEFEIPETPEAAQKRFVDSYQEYEASENLSTVDTTEAEKTPDQKIAELTALIERQSGQIDTLTTKVEELSKQISGGKPVESSETNNDAKDNGELKYEPIANPEEVAIELQPKPEVVSTNAEGIKFFTKIGAAMDRVLDKVVAGYEWTKGVAKKAMDSYEKWPLSAKLGLGLGLAVTGAFIPGAAPVAWWAGTGLGVLGGSIAGRAKYRSKIKQYSEGGKTVTRGQKAWAATLGLTFGAAIGSARFWFPTEWVTGNVSAGFQHTQATMAGWFGESATAGATTEVVQASVTGGTESVGPATFAELKAERLGDINSQIADIPNSGSTKGYPEVLHNLVNETLTESNPHKAQDLLEYTEKFLTEAKYYAIQDQTAGLLNEMGEHGFDLENSSYLQSHWQYIDQALARGDVAAAEQLLEFMKAEVVTPTVELNKALAESVIKLQAAGIHLADHPQVLDLTQEIKNALGDGNFKYAEARLSELQGLATSFDANSVMQNGQLGVEMPYVAADPGVQNASLGGYESAEGQFDGGDHDVVGADQSPTPESAKFTPDGFPVQTILEGGPADVGGVDGVIKDSLKNGFLRSVAFDSYMTSGQMNGLADAVNKTIEESAGFNKPNYINLLTDSPDFNPGASLTPERLLADSSFRADLQAKLLNDYPTLVKQLGGEDKVAKLLDSFSRVAIESKNLGSPIPVAPSGPSIIA